MSLSLSAADTLDSDGYPIMYVRGTATGNWDALSNYRMHRDGDVYSITLPELDGEWKISGNSWQYNFGAEGAKLQVSPDSEIKGVQGGANFIASNLYDVTISFTHSKDDFASFAPALITVRASRLGSEPSGTLPVLYINVYDESHNLNNEIIDRNLSHKNYFVGEYWLDMMGCDGDDWEGAASLGSPQAPLPLQIKARGNYTRTGFSKKPFKIKLDKKQALCGLSKSKHFALLAHADDNFGYLRNFCGFNLGRRIGLPWTPGQRPVELVVNGDYRGLYFLTESIRVEDGRIEIAELPDKSTDLDLITGGYVVELDNYDESNQLRMPEKAFVKGHINDLVRVTFDTPEEYSPLQERFIREQFEAINDYVGNNDSRVWGYLDLDDAARYYIVEEVITHTEAFHGSTYLFRDRGAGQKWHFSPLWDCGNAFNGSPEDFLYNQDSFGNTWIPSLSVNPEFDYKVKETWRWFIGEYFDGFYDDMDRYVRLISKGAVADRARWKNAPRPDSGNATDVADNSDMEGRCNKVRDHISRKVSMLASRWGEPERGLPEPERDDTPAAMLAEWITAGVDSVEASADGTAYYYNMQGIRVANPRSGETYIEISGGKSRKVRF